MDVDLDELCEAMETVSPEDRGLRGEVEGWIKRYTLTEEAASMALKGAYLEKVRERVYALTANRDKSASSLLVLAGEVDDAFPSMLEDALVDSIMDTVEEICMALAPSPEALMRGVVSPLLLIAWDAGCGLPLVAMRKLLRMIPWRVTSVLADADAASAPCPHLRERLLGRKEYAPMNFFHTVVLDTPPSTAIRDAYSSLM